MCHNIQGLADNKDIFVSCICWKTLYMTHNTLMHACESKEAFEFSPHLFSGITGEVVYYGILFPWTMLISATLSVLIVGNLFLPIFFKMRLTSVYEVCTHMMTVKSWNYISWNNDMSRKWNRIIDDVVMEVSIEKSPSHNKFRYYDGFSAEWGLS